MDIHTLLALMIQLLIIGGVFWLIWWLIGFVNPPEPFNKILRVIVAIIAVVILANILLGMVGESVMRIH